MSQGERLKSLIIELLESPHSFAIGVGLSSATSIYDVMNGKRSLSPALIKKIIDTYPNINPDWLIKGTFPKLLTGKTELKEEGNVEEGRKIYNSKCPFCYEKDKEIANLKNKLIESQRQYINCLKEVLELKKIASG